MPTKFKGTLEEETTLNAFICLMRASASVSHRVNEHLREVDMTSPQFAVLEALLHLGQLKQCELARKLLTSPGNLSLLLTSMEQRGLIVRELHKPDRRSTTVSLSPAGLALIEPTFKEHMQEMLQAFAALSLEEREQLHELCRRLGKGATAANASSR
jgi:MarR family 2-MHQ and catechol resistance regulon transcriptional repressor